MAHPHHPQRRLGLRPRYCFVEENTRNYILPFLPEQRRASRRRCLGQKGLDAPANPRIPCAPGTAQMRPNSDS